ncbi:GNAT family N-acetyltransferase [Nonomuraea zeae]|uniref:GNAT family N-acetyltransferase n=1 Tax=Nonomuraea zeae TaxID=1642303 RepID=A0A5S4GKC9_9ACTN|nr:GNAT family N-acetyltransferase [Nonomuraea zeae]TMR32994.1 GNAT family N-acetyltransferase [Nonomuraea zeae]
MHIRFGTKDDAEHIATLHAQSWLTAYTGIMPASYLNGPRLLDERKTLWTTRLTTVAPEPDRTSCLLVAVDDSATLGFAYLALEADGRILLDNLHVRPRRKGSGIGRHLMQHACAWTANHHAGKAVYLEVLQANVAAIAFYERLGGRPTRQFVERFPAGFELPVVEYTWDLDAVSALAATCFTGDQPACLVDHQEQRASS